MPDAKHTLKLTTDELLVIISGLEKARALTKAVIVANETQLGVAELETASPRSGLALDAMLVETGILRQELASIDSVIEDHLKPCFGDLYDEIMKGGM